MTWHQNGLRRAKTGALAVILIVFVGFGGWSATAPIAGAVIAPGKVKVLSNRKAVQHEEGGIVEAILVHDGDRVQTGDIVIRLDATRARNSHNLLVARRDHFLASIARLRAELRGDGDLVLSGGAAAASETMAEMVESQRELLNARVQMLASSKAMIDEQIEQMKQEVHGLETKIEEKAFQIASITSEIEDLEQLFRERLTPRSRLLALQREAAELRSERAEAVARIGAIRRSMAEASQERSRTRAEFHERANRELNEAQAELNEVIEQLDSAAHSLAHSEIRATADGVVVGLAVHTVGGVIAPGDTLLEILPAEESLVVEARIRLNDIDLVSEGQPVDIRFLSSTASMLDDLPAQLTYVSADSLYDERADESYFIARARLDNAAREPELARLLQPGLAAEMFITTGERTPLEYLAQPLRESLSRAWREK